MTHGVTVTRLRATPTLDPYSDEWTASDWSTPDELAIPGCGWAPARADESTVGMVEVERLQSMATIYAPWGVDVRSEDRIRTADGQVWQVVGDASQWTSPLTGWRPGSVILVEKFEARS